jgi:hypothetical protein
MSISFYLKSSFKDYYLSVPRKITMEDFKKLRSVEDVEEVNGELISYERVKISAENAQKMIAKGMDVEEVPKYFFGEDDPSVEISNRNAHELIRLLGLPWPEGEIKPKELLSKIGNLEGKLSAVIVEPTDTGENWSGKTGPRTIDPGLSGEYVQYYLDELQELCAYAIQYMEKSLQRGQPERITIRWA